MMRPSVELRNEFKIDLFLAIGRLPDFDGY